MRPVIFLLVLALVGTSMGEARAWQNAVEFDDVTLLVLKDKKIETVPVRLRLTHEALVMETRKSLSGVLKQFPFGEIKSAEYSYSQHPRWKEGLGASAVGVSLVGISLGAAALGPLAVFVAIPIFIKTTRMKGKKHWLTIKTEQDFAVLQLDKKNYRMLLPSLETRAKIKIETVAEK